MPELKAASFDPYGTLVDAKGAPGTLLVVAAGGLHTRVGELVER